MFVVDINVLVYVADVSAPEHPCCRALLDRWRVPHGAWCLTGGNGYEFLRVVTRPRVLRKPSRGPAAGEFLTAVQPSPGLSMRSPTDRHAAVLAEVMSAVPLITGNLWHDAETAVLMRERGIRRICTRDTGFSRFPFIEVVDPLTSEP